MAKAPKESKDDDRETEILRRMLNTPPKPHKPKKDKLPPKNQGGSDAKKGNLD
jgi:hypothetical protein